MAIVRNRAHNKRECNRIRAAAPLEEAQCGIGLEVFDEEAGGDGPPGALDGGVEQGVSDAASPVFGGDENLADGGVGAMLILQEAHPHDAGGVAVHGGDDPVLGVVGEAQKMEPHLVLDVVLVLGGIDLGGEDGLLGEPGAQDGGDGGFVPGVVWADVGGFRQ